jgi:hypothetical protein
LYTRLIVFLFVLDHSRTGEAVRKTYRPTSLQ